MNAIPTSTRLRFLAQEHEKQTCWLCGHGTDSQSHLFEDCMVVNRVKEAIATESFDPRGTGLAAHEMPSTRDVATVGGFREKGKTGRTRASAVLFPEGRGMQQNERQTMQRDL